ncbi:septal ring lytic transglycosylase RlpA family lipoprotein [Aliidiomarina minuta]|uniref:Endolytic peptidoglycan transglycosylase RlpA n=2 Tax=Aliidiomarina minuta TaxID=880057 RepID=A0A432WAI6_9GAMM|nr:septal ring lytic transglycosylase RlpA family lipoprotein [Aliidiomarina minuta]
MKFTGLFFAVILLVGCSSVPKHSPPELVGFTEAGEASFYANKYQFRQTASGERLNQLADTAAHKTLPFGTQVKVTNRNNGESVIVKINDRGPFIDGRIIDLTRSAFGRIGNTSSGVIPVEIEVVK